mgnify:FL=1
MIGLLFNWRIWAAVSIAVALAASHWKAYHAGGASAREELSEYLGEVAVKAAKASEDARQKENALNLSNERIRNALAKEKAARAADAVATADRLRDYESTLDSLRAKDSTTGPGADDPPVAIARECAKQLIVLDQYAQGLASQTRGLQAYAAEVCMK